MGIFDSLFNNNRSQPSNPNRNTNPTSIYDTAIRLIHSGSYEKELQGRDMMLNEIEKASYMRIDPRIYYWFGQDYEAHKCYHSAYEWYKKALEAGVREAAAAIKRCDNPYNVDTYYNISGERGDGTHHANYYRKAKESYSALFIDARNKFLNSSSIEEGAEYLHTIYLLATAQSCVVPKAKTFIGDRLNTEKKDYAEAAKWYKDAADNGDAEGARKYAAALAQGIGVEKNEAEANRYLEIAHKIEIQDPSQKPPTKVKPTISNQDGNSEQNKIIIQKYIEIHEKHVLSADKEHACAKTLFPLCNAFCDRAYEYCIKQYGTDDPKKLAFEMCMTPFYGAICCVALWYQNKSLFEKEETSAWDILNQFVDVNKVDAEAEKLLNTKQGEDKAEQIYNIISEYMDVVRPIILQNKAKGNTSLLGMKQAYSLGLRQAITLIEAEKNKIQYDDTQNNIGTKTTEEKAEDQSFYSKCVEAFHEEAQKYGVAKRGLIFIPELMPRGEKVVLSFLQDPYYQSVCNGNAMTYYYLMMSLSIQSGLVFADTWHKDFYSLDECEAEIIIDGPADKANELLEKYFSRDISANQGNGFYQKIYSIWLKQHEPYWKLQDPRDYTFKDLIAAYQLGISMMLEKHNF